MSSKVYRICGFILSTVFVHRSFNSVCLYFIVNCLICPDGGGVFNLSRYKLNIILIMYY